MASIRLVAVGPMLAVVSRTVAAIEVSAAAEVGLISASAADSVTGFVVVCALPVSVVGEAGSSSATYVD